MSGTEADGPRPVTTDLVRMELLAGASNDLNERRVRRMLEGIEIISVTAPTDFDQAAAIFRACTRAGRRVQSLDDCLIAAVAIRAGTAVLHRDRDFDSIAACTALRLALS